MTQEQITEGENSIAAFMESGYWQIWSIGGYKAKYSDKFADKESAQKLIDTAENPRGEKYMAGLCEPKYHSPKYSSDWNLLMPVVEKIESLGHQIVIVGGDSVWGNYCNIMTNISLVEASLENPSKFVGKSDSKHESVFSAVVQFIKWLNTQSK